MAEADGALEVFDLLMGSDVAPRKEFIVEGASGSTARGSTHDRAAAVVADAVAAHGLEVEVLACDPSSPTPPSSATTTASPRRRREHDHRHVRRRSSRRCAPVCVVLGTTRLDVNKVCRERLGVKRISFADADTTVELTGMEIGGVTAPGVEGCRWIDARCLERPAS